MFSIKVQGLTEFGSGGGGGGGGGGNRKGGKKGAKLKPISLRAGVRRFNRGAPLPRSTPAGASRPR